MIFAHVSYTPASWLPGMTICLSHLVSGNCRIQFELMVFSL